MNDSINIQVRKMTSKMKHRINSFETSQDTLTNIIKNILDLEKVRNSSKLFMKLQEILIFNEQVYRDCYGLINQYRYLRIKISEATRDPDEKVCHRGLLQKVDLTSFKPEALEIHHDFDLNSLPSYIKLGERLNDLIDSKYLEDMLCVKKKLEDVIKLYVLMREEFIDVQEDLRYLKEAGQYIDKVKSN